jgi:hypothetical protein
MATRYWVGGTGNWTNTARWSATSGGTGGASVPGTGDTVTFNSSSGGGTATLDASFTVQTLTMTGYTGTLAYGTNTISLNNTSGTIFTGDTTYSVSGTPVINVISVGSTAITILSGATTEANSVSFNFTGGTYALTFLGLPAGQAAKNVNFTGFAGSWSKNNGILYGNITLSSSMTLVSGSYFVTCAATSGTQIITTNGVLINGSLTINGVGGTVQLADTFTLGSTGNAINLLNGTFDGNSKTISGGNLSAGFYASASAGSTTIKNIVSTGMGLDQSAGTITLGSDVSFGGVFGSNNLGTVNLVSYKLTCTGFSSNAATSRTIAFGTGNITVDASAVAAATTVWTTATTTNLTVTGTPVVNISNPTTTAIVVATGILTEAQSISFNFINGSYSLSFLNVASYSAKSVDFTGFTGTWAAHNAAATLYGSLTLSTGMTFTASGGAMTFGASSGTQTITTSGKTYDQAITINCGGTVRLIDAVLMGTSRAFTHTAGTLDLNGKTLTVGTTYTTAAGTKVLTFNGGTLVCPAVTTTAFNNAAPTGFSTVAGTGTGTISMTGATAKSFVGGGSTFNCTLSNDGAGALTITGGNTFTTLANGVQPTTFSFTAATTTTVTNFNLNGVSGSLVTINSATAATHTLSKASGTILAQYLSITNSIATGGATWYAVNSTNGGGNTGWVFGVNKYWVGGTGNWSTAARWALSSNGAGGAGINIADNAVFDSLSGGGTSSITSDVSVQTLTMTGYTGNLSFGSNTISLTTAVPGTAYTGDSTYTVGATTGTVATINITNPTANALTIDTGATVTEANTISFNFTAGTYALTIAASSRVRNLNFTGFAGTFVSTGISIYGDLNLGSTANFTATLAWTFTSTSATTRTITSNGITLDRPLTFNGVNGKWQLIDPLMMGSARTLTQNNGTLDLNGKTLTVGTRYTTGTGTKVLTFNGGTLICPNGNTTSFNNAVPTGFSTVATGTISMTAATAKTFVGGGSTFNCTVSNGGAGLLTISGNNTISTVTTASGSVAITGSNTITTISNSAQPVTFTFTASTTQTITNWNVNGTAGNLVTIVSSAAGTPASLSKSSGTVSADYLSIKDSTATGGAVWYAGANSTNVSGNSGWIFTAPSMSSGNFFLLF